MENKRLEPIQGVSAEEIEASLSKILDRKAPPVTGLSGKKISEMNLDELTDELLNRLKLAEERNQQPRA